MNVQEVSVAILLFCLPALIGIFARLHSAHARYARLLRYPHFVDLYTAIDAAAGAIVVFVFLLRFAVVALWNDDRLLGEYGTFHLINFVCLWLLGYMAGFQIYLPDPEGWNHWAQKAHGYFFQGIALLLTAGWLYILIVNQNQ